MCETNPYDEYAKERLMHDLKDRRVLTLDYDIDDSLFELISKLIIEYNCEDKDLPVEKRKPIILHIASNGGDVVPGLALLSVIESSKTPVYTVVVQQAFSMAIYIAAAGHKRYAFKNSMWLIHDGAIEFESTQRKAKDQMQFTDRINLKLEDVLLANTKLTKEDIEEHSDREWYITAEEAKKYGIVDYIVGEDCELDEIA